MITIDEIRKYYPDLQGFDRSILREYLQYKILDIVFRNKIASRLSFLGGTAIRLCYGSSRFSEDLDFDNFNLDTSEFSRLCEDIKKKLTYEGYSIETRIVFKKTFRCYIKFLQLLYDNKLSNHKDEKLVIQIDTTPHGFQYTPDNFKLQRFDVFRNIRVTPVDIVLSQKVGAVFGRRREKGRDFYDVVYLMGITDFNFDYLKFKLGIANKMDLKKRLAKATRKGDFEKLARDVLPFLIDPDGTQRVTHFKEYIKQELQENN
ncbi:nucleotidyl transferase AbiEii/AbiGii toxin family protein [Patescibacteria group bacterium AH-259-L05]|nr:nucleotidyl transferase AbiEii/AbiGii toxin family protein [Patescibacteria group bacterium AH-259-L05]